MAKKMDNKMEARVQIVIRGFRVKAPGLNVILFTSIGSRA